MSLSAAAAAVDFVAGKVMAAQPLIVQTLCVSFARWRQRARKGGGGGWGLDISIQGI